jgi:hypothetical protein
MNVEMSQDQKNKWSKTSYEELFQVGNKAHLYHKTQNTCPAHLYITSNNVSMSTHTRLWLPKINQGIFRSYE